MRSKVVKSLALLLLLCGVSVAQQPGTVEKDREDAKPSPQAKKKAPAEKSKLEGILAEALKNNPDIRVAAAKLAMAEAELNRTRIQVTQEIVRVHSVLQSQEAEVNRWTSECERLAREVQRAVVAPQVLEESRQQLKKAKAKRAELEAQIAALLGRSVRLGSNPEARKGTHTIEGDSGELRFRVIEALVDLRAKGPLADRMRKALQTPVKVDYKNMSFDAILKDLAKEVPGLSFRNVFPEDNSAQKMNLQFEEALPVSAILQAVVDETGCRFFVREYGILATTVNAVPPGAITVEQFLRQKPTEK